MKIAFFVSRFPKLSETFILNQITGLIDRGHKVDIFASMLGEDSAVHATVKEYGLLDSTIYYKSISRNPANKLLRFLKAIILILANFHKNPVSLLKSLNILKYGKKSASLNLLYATISFLNRGPYDIVHSHFGPNGNFAVLLKDIGTFKGKFLTTFHGSDVNRYPKLYGEDVYLDLFKKVDLVTVNSNFTKSKVKCLGCNEDKIIKLPVGLNTARFIFKERVLNPGDEIKILTVGRLVEKKGLRYSIEAVAEIIKKKPAIQYNIVGEGVLRDQLLELIRQLCVEDKVKLLGSKNHDEIHQLYSEAHIFILSSVTADDGDREGQGLVLQEAQAMGLPVIATLHNGFPESVVDGESGYLVPEKDVDSLTERLEYLIEKNADWPAMGRVGRKFVEENFDINKLNDRLVDIYHKIINNHTNENSKI